MSKSNKELRIKKLGNIHIWPSIVAMCFTILIIMSSIVFFSAVIFSLSLDSIMELSTKDFENVNKELQQVDKDKENYVEALEKFNDKWDRIYSIQLYNDDDKLLASDGQVFDTKDILWTFDLYNQFGVILDKSLLNDADEYFDVCKKGWKHKKQLKNQVLYEHPVWIIFYPLDSNDYIIFSSSMIFTNKIYYSILLMIIVLSVISLIPFIFLIINIIRNTHYNKKIKNLLYTDMETGGKNWIYFEDRAKKILVRDKNASYALVEFQIVDYTKYQTFHSTDECQSLLEYLYNHLDRSIPSHRNEICAHVSKDDFVMLLQITEFGDIKKRIQVILDSFTKEKNLNIHAGYYVIPGEQTRKLRKELNLEELYNDASMAQRSSSDKKENTLVEFNSGLLDQQIWENKVIVRIDEAIANQEFKVYIQPKYDPVNEVLTGAEALIRWINDEDGFIGPGRFIPIYEKTGLITKIDDFMLDNVAKLQSEWLKQGRKLVPISVNVSRAHFAQSNLAEHIAAIVDKYELPHKYIEIELTESAFFDDKEKLLEIVNNIKQLGFEVSMDDFGAGYSSLNSLKDLPLDVLKLDAEFFRGDAEGERAQIVVGDAISLAKHLNMRVVAEGIEKKEQVDFLAKLGCDMIQGFYFSKPVPASEYEEKMDKQKA